MGIQHTDRVHFHDSTVILQHQVLHIMVGCRLPYGTVNYR